MLKAQLAANCAVSADTDCVDDQSKEAAPNSEGQIPEGLIPTFMDLSHM